MNKPLISKRIMRMITSLSVAAILAAMSGCQSNSPMNVSSDPVTTDMASNPAVTDEGTYYRLADDMIFYKNDPASLKLLGEIVGSGGSQKTAFASYANPSRWPGNLVPFYFEGNWTSSEKSVALSAMNKYKSTCYVTFRETSARGNYILKMVKGATSGCYAAGQSTIGYVANSTITIAPEQILYHVILHELGHTLGFMHEHQRPDRDSYITINTNNLQSAVISQFNIVNPNINHSTYDVKSIMHYKSYTKSLCVVKDTNQPMFYIKAGGSVDNRDFSTSDINGLRSILGTVGTSKFATVYRKSTASESYVWDWKRADFITKVNQMAQSGYKVKEFDVYVINNTELYYAAFEVSSANEYGILGYNRTDFITRLNEGYNNGYRVNTMRAFTLNGTELYTAFFRPNTSGEQYVLGFSQTDFVNKYNQLYSQGYRLAKFDTYVMNNAAIYSGLFRPSTAEEILYVNYTQTNFANLINSQAGAGKRLNNMSVAVVNGTPYYSGTFRSSTAAQAYAIGFLRIDMEFDMSSNAWGMIGQGWRPYAMCGY